MPPSLRSCLPLLLLAAAALPGCFVTRAVGLTHPGANEAVKTDTPEEMYAKAQNAYAEQDWKTAAESFGMLWKQNPKSGLAADAQFYEAESRYGQGKLNGAFELYKRYLKNWPLSPHAPTIEKRIYEIGRRTIEAGQHGFLGIFNYADEGVDELDFLVSAFPHGDLADDALLCVADYEWKSRQTKEAIGHLQDLIDDFPSSEWVLDARLRLARAFREVNRGLDYDGDALKRSAAQYRAYVEIVAADRARAAEYAAQLDVARAELAEVEEQLARKGVASADFYLRAGNAEAARAELKNVIRDYPRTQAAAEAQSRLGIEAAPEEPAPAPGQGGGR